MQIVLPQNLDSHEFRFRFSFSASDDAIGKISYLASYLTKLTQLCGLRFSELELELELE